MLANLRNLAIAELRAATDSLTGLPNTRAVRDTVKRMAAQAGRTKAPLAAGLLDLDHFKQVNDTTGTVAATTSSPLSAPSCASTCARAISSAAWAARNS